MSVRSNFGSIVGRLAGEHRLNLLRGAEDRFRRGLSGRIHPTGGIEPAVAPVGAPALRESEPPSLFAAPDMSRHELLAGLHRVLAPRTYLEIGVNDGLSLALARARSIGIDPDFAVRSEVECAVQLVRSTSDEFFARPDPTAYLEGMPIDLAFIDGMHLAEFVYRDFMHLEPLMATTGVIVLDDMLPRDSDEAARNRATRFWAGDVFKFAAILADLRPDLVIVPVNTAPTGVIVVTALDPTSRVLADRYDDVIEHLTAPDPQVVPLEIVHRQQAVGASSLIRSSVLGKLQGLREADAMPGEVRRATASLRRLKRLGMGEGITDA